MALAPGTRLGSYEVTALIGQGGMGEVYRARDTTLDWDVALKVLPQAFTEMGVIMGTAAYRWLSSGLKRQHATVPHVTEVVPCGIYAVSQFSLV